MTTQQTKDKSPPLTLDQGLEKFLSLYQSQIENIVFIDVVRTSKLVNGKPDVDEEGYLASESYSTVLRLLIDELGLTDPCVLPYVPPSETAHNPEVRNGLVERTEYIPRISEPNKIHIIVDDLFHEGHTLNHATDRLKKQGARLIWFYCPDIMSTMHRNKLGFFDTAESFLDYKDLL